MTAFARHLTAATAAVVSRTIEEPAGSGAAWSLLGALAPAALWGLPLAYVFFSVVSRRPRRPGAPEERSPPRDASLVDRLSMSGDSRERW